MHRHRSRTGGLRERRRGGIDARDLPARRGAPCIPERRSAPRPRLPRSRNSSRSRPRPKCSRRAPARWRRRTSRSASFRSPAPRPSSWRTRWASIPSKGSTSRWSRPQAGRSSATRPSTRNTTRPICCRPCRSRSRSGSAPSQSPSQCPRSRTSTARRSRSPIKHKDKRDPKQWKGFQVRDPFDYSMHNYLLRYYLAEHGRRPGCGRAAARRAAAGNGGEPARGQHRRLSRTRQRLSAGDLRRRRLPPYPVEGDLGRTSLLQLHRQQGVHHADAEQLRGAGARHRGCDCLCLESGEPQADRRDDRAGQLS